MALLVVQELATVRMLDTVVGPDGDALLVGRLALHISHVEVLALGSVVNGEEPTCPRFAKTGLETSWQVAQQVLDRLKLTRSGLLNVQNLDEFYHHATRKLGPTFSPAEAMAQISLFTWLWPFFELTPRIVLEAERGVRDMVWPLPMPKSR